MHASKAVCDVTVLLAFFTNFCQQLVISVVEVALKRLTIKPIIAGDSDITREQIKKFLPGKK
ncbi:hypothetical protein [Cellvibrio polysaccharolyticus]|uniref:Uncharacterized protein n=1 Tax=Cellvibrio polysaccharolyticus TaxID=2082724 RepID=A0A928V1X0_9GAMM|nr:hypothetical protein [Cellvibrio polysaccharolyticus]MBE8716767.1 hypothetical protein [Cellvibrio polysaccharolyticus]